jgi:hypothetical protein
MTVTVWVAPGTGHMALRRLGNSWDRDEINHNGRDSHPSAWHKHSRCTLRAPTMQRLERGARIKNLAASAVTCSNPWRVLLPTLGRYRKYIGGGRERWLASQRRAGSCVDAWALRYIILFYWFIFILKRLTKGSCIVDVLTRMITLKCRRSP